MRCERGGRCFLDKERVGGRKEETSLPDSMRGGACRGAGDYAVSRRRQVGPNAGGGRQRPEGKVVVGRLARHDTAWTRRGPPHHHRVRSLSSAVVVNGRPVGCGVGMFRMPRELAWPGSRARTAPVTTAAANQRCGMGNPQVARVRTNDAERDGTGPEGKRTTRVRRGGVAYSRSSSALRADMPARP